MGTRQDVVGLYTSGMSVAKVAAFLGKNPSTVYVHLIHEGVLRRKAFSTPKVFKGKAYRKTKLGYWRRLETVNGKRTVFYLHREVWAAAHGKIRKNWEVHHKDHDPDNNLLSNLVAMPPQRHAEYHRNLEAMCRTSKAKPQSKSASGTSRSARSSR